MRREEAHELLNHRLGLLQLRAVAAAGDHRHALAVWQVVSIPAIVSARRKAGELSEVDTRDAVYDSILYFGLCLGI